MATSGLFISFEGIDGAGKSTHIDALAAEHAAAAAPAPAAVSDAAPAAKP